MKSSTSPVSGDSGVIDSFVDERLKWHNGFPNHQIEEGGRALLIEPTPKKDYWSRTFYEPLLVKHDAECLLTPVAADIEATIKTSFTLRPCEQFDQAGIMVLVDENCWVKAGIEFTDGIPRLSCVVTNDGYSDWSTQEWTDWDEAARSTSIRVRLSKILPGSEQGPAVIFEAARWEAGTSVDSPARWFQVRIASLRSNSQPWKMGLFAISPIAGGSSTRFHHIKLGPKEEPVHSADAGI